MMTRTGDRIAKAGNVQENEWAKYYGQSIYSGTRCYITKIDGDRAWIRLFGEGVAFEVDKNKLWPVPDYVATIIDSALLMMNSHRVTMVAAAYGGKGPETDVRNRAEERFMEGLRELIRHELRRLAAEDDAGQVLTEGCPTKPFSNV